MSARIRKLVARGLRALGSVSARSRNLVIGGVLALTVGVTVWSIGLSAEAAWTAGVTALCASWWVLEPIPIPATSLIPFALFPLVGVSDHRQVASAYGHTLILLLMGGFILSKSVEKSGVHRRIALGIVRKTGGHGKRLVLGFMLATAACSMWISNTATALMLLPVALAALEQSRDDNLEVPLLLGIAYSASIGGVATPIGTPPNVFFTGFYERKGVEISFLEWMQVGVPVVLILLPITWWLLTRKVARGQPPDLPRSGPWSSAEKRVLVVFALTAAAWVFRTAPFGGWVNWFGADGAGDSTVALAAVVVLFLVPDGDDGALLDWDTAKTIPWGLLLLFGGGIAIADAFSSSGLADAIGDALSGVAGAPSVVVVLVICLSTTFLTEVVSNTATTTLLMPLLFTAAIAGGIDPPLLLVPATISASCAFMLPVATAPNAIVHGTGKVPSRVMAAEGIRLNVVAGVTIALLVWVLFEIGLKPPSPPIPG